MVAETGLEPASTDYEPVPGGFTTPVYSASTFSNWLRRKDSNLRMTRSRDERRSAWLLRNGISDSIADRRFASGIKFLTPRTNRKSAIKNRKCFWWTWHDLNVRPRPSQSCALIPLSYRSEDWYGHPMRGVSDPSFLAPNLPAARSTIRTQAMAEMERFERSQDFSRHLSGVLPCQLGDISKWRKATESNRTRLLAAAVFKTV